MNTEWFTRQTRLASEATAKWPDWMRKEAGLKVNEMTNIQKALYVIEQEMKKSPDWANTWHANLAMMAYDAGAPHDKANEHAKDFMKRAFNVDIKLNRK